MNHGPKYKYKTVELVEEIIGTNSHCLELGNEFFVTTPKAQSMK